MKDTKIELGQLKQLPALTDAWEHEALNFTPWLSRQENLDLLGSAVNLQMRLVKTECHIFLLFRTAACSFFNIHIPADDGSDSHLRRRFSIGMSHKNSRCFWEN